jgi:hypothetical protein
MAALVLSELEEARLRIHGGPGQRIDRAQVMSDLRHAFSHEDEETNLRTAYWRGLLFVRFGEHIRYDPAQAPPNFIEALTAHETAVRRLTSFEDNAYIILGLH